MLPQEYGKPVCTPGSRNEMFCFAWSRRSFGSEGGDRKDRRLGKKDSLRGSQTWSFGPGQSLMALPAKMASCFGVLELWVSEIPNNKSQITNKSQ
jgi:hypothetical protein